jgi:hypothetical protein
MLLTRATFSALIVFVGTASASPSGRIMGIVRDPSGAAVSRASVTVVDPAEAQLSSVRSDPAGAFEFANLPPGAWSLSVEADGFKLFRVREVVVQVDQTTTVNVALEIGPVTEIVEITGAAPAAAGAVIDHQAIPAMPLNGRQYLDLAALAPGVVPAAPGTQGNGFNSAGMRSQSNVYLLDGVSNVDTQTNQPLNLFRITDAVEEFSIQTVTPTPEFGRGTGAQIDVVTRRGGNQWHGGAFEYLRNTALTAADFFTNKLAGPKNALNRNEFGLSAGGAIVRNRIFVFGSYEGFRQVAPAVSTVLVPTEAQRASVTDPIAQRLLDYFPIPNTSGSPNYISNVRSRDSDDTALVRVDYAAARDQISGRWTEYWGTSVVPGPTLLTGGSAGPLGQISAMTNWEHTFSPRFSHGVRIGESRYTNERSPQDTGLNAAAIIDVPGVPMNAGLPSIAIGGGFAALGSNANFPQGRISNTIEASENGVLMRFRHSWRWGFHIRREDLSRYLNRASRGMINFASFADFARGQINTATFRTGSTQAYWRRYPWDWFWMDEFRVLPNLTIQYGVRYEYQSAVRELRGRATNFVEGYGSMLAGTNKVLDIDAQLTGAASFAYRTAPFRLPSSGAFADRNNFAPMIGFAWASGETVLRGGARMAYDDLFNNVPSAMALAVPWNLQTTQTANVTQPGRFGWALAFNQDVPLTSSGAGVLTFQGIDTGLRSAYAYLWHLGVGRRIGGLAVDVDYRGSSGHALGMYLDANEPMVVVRDPSRRGPVAPNQQVFPYPHFGQAQIAKSIGASNYESMVATVRRQDRRGLFQASYTLGKSLDYNSSYFGSGNLPGELGAPIDSRNIRLEHGPSAFDVRHRVVVLYTIDLPGARSPGMPRMLFGGWRLAGIVTAQSGNPFTVVLGGPDTSGFNSGNRPDVVRAGPLSQNNREPDGAFDTSWFAPNGPGRNGTSGRNAYRGPGMENIDVALTKRIPLGRRELGVSAELRADFFNSLNHTNFANPISDMNNANFGRITQTLGSAVGTSTGTSGGAGGGPRIIQVSARLQF